MTRYLLDANAVIALLRDPGSRLVRRLRQEALANVAISAIVAHELYYDALIAGQALARNLILVTHNTAEFARVPGLRLEDREA